MKAWARIRRLFGGVTAVAILNAGMIGLATGFTALAFRALVDGVARSAFGGDSVLDQAAELHWFLLLLLPVAGLTAAHHLTRWLAPEAKGHGIPEVMYAVREQGGRIRPRVVLVKALASALTIGTGGSVGREGPIVQIGSAVGSTLAQWLGRDRDRTRLLVACGAAGGIAATFNAPIAGVVFAIEVILGHGAIRAFSPIVVASVVATAVSRWFSGPAPAFEVPSYTLESPAELVSYAVLGLFAGLAAVTFIRVLYGMIDAFEDLPYQGILPPVLAGLLVGGIGLVAPGIYGLGYETIELALDARIALSMLVFLFVGKLFATALTLAGGGSGGVFAPSLFLGASLGGAVGIAANRLDLWPTASPGAYALVGMGAVVAAATHAPLTAILIIFELTGDYAIILPLMLACIVASALAVSLYPESIYTSKLARRGLRTKVSPEVSAVLDTTVRDLMRTARCRLGPDTPFEEIVDHVAHSEEDVHYVVDERGALVGVIALHDVKGLLEDEAPAEMRTARDMMTGHTHAVRTDDKLEICLDRFKQLDHEELPVVEPSGALVGVIARKDIMGLYDRELLRRSNLGMKFVTLGDGGARADYVELPPGYEVAAVEVPAAFVGKTLRELDLRSRHELLVVGVRKRGGAERGSPDPQVPLAAGTVLVVEGPSREVQWLRGLG